MSNAKNTQSGIDARLRQVVERYRTKMGIPATGFASLTDIPYRSLQNYLRGEREPSISALSKIAAATLTDLNWLITGRGHEWLGDYPPKKEIDKLLTVMLPSILDELLKIEKNNFSKRERVQLISYMMHANTLGLGDAIRTLWKHGAALDFEELPSFLEYMKEVTSPTEAES